MRLRKILKKFYSSVVPGEERSCSMNNRRRLVHGEADEEGFSHPTTRCLSSYYSIFVARMAMMVMLAILIGMLTILTWHFTRVYTTTSLNSLAYGLRYELLQRPILRMWNILNSTVEIIIAQVKLSEYVIGRYDIQVSQEEQNELYRMMKNITWALFASRKALNAITISYKNGFVQAFHRDVKSNTTFYIYSELVNTSSHKNQPGNQLQRSNYGNVSSIWYREPLNPITGETLGEKKRIPPDDLIDIAQLQEVSDGVASWRVTVSKFTYSPQLSAAMPVRHPSGGNIVAAVGVTTALKSVGQLMKELVGFHSGYMYLATRDGYVLATSTNAPLLRNTTAGLRLVLANDSDNYILRSGAEWLQSTYGNQFPINHEVHAQNVILGKRKYYIDSFFLNLKRLPLVGVIIIPRKYIMGKVDQIGFTTLVILISASMCILVIGCICIFILTSGVSRAMKLRAELISHLDARRRAEASSSYKSQFLANMSHELRTPMAAVIGLLDILIYDGCLSNEQFSTIQQIRKCSTALLRLLNNILDLSKVESGKLILEEAEFDLGQELEGLADMFSVQCINHNVEIILDLSDNLPKKVKGDSARVVQIFTNLITNSIKFTMEGHIILRAWCECFQGSSMTELANIQKISQSTPKRKFKQDESSIETDCKKKDRITICFEVEDTGYGIDPSKWESVFESFEQADPSTTRKHGGTGLGLCIVRNLVNKMDGEIKVVKKDGPGTLMQLKLVLGMPEDGTRKHFQAEFGKHRLMVLLAVKGSKGRLITCQWLRRNGVFTWETSDWNGLAQTLQQVFKGNGILGVGLDECSTSEPSILNRMRVVPKQIEVPNLNNSNIVIVVDTNLLDQSTNIWKEQLIFLDQYHKEAKFAWVLSHDTSNDIKMELRRRSQFLMINKPLYKTKMIHILDSVIKERSLENQRCESARSSNIPDNLHECHEIDPIHFEAVSSYASSDIEENVDLRNNASHLREETEEFIAISHHPCYQTFDSVKESSHEVLLDNSLQNPNSLPVEETLPDELKEFANFDNHAINRMEDSTGNEKEKDEKQNMITAKAEKLHELEPCPAVSFTEKFKNVFVQKNQMCRTKQDDQYHSNSTLFNMDESRHKMPEKRTESASGIQQAELVKGRHSTQKVTELIDRSSNRHEQYNTFKDDRYLASKKAPQQKTLEGLYILLAEDNPILQRVATMMLEKVGATVMAVGDGMQAVKALECAFGPEEGRRQSSFEQNGKTTATEQLKEDLPFDLILMDCQMPMLDGYEATKAIRKLEAGTSSHIPIVAVTAHAMSSDEAKCLKVGMDAYLTKPIDCELMVSTILALTKRNM